MSSSARRVAGIVAAAICGLGWTFTAFARDEGPVQKINREAKAAKISVTPLRGGLSVLMGSGGNITLLDGKDGRLLVDSGISLSREAITVALGQSGDGKVRYLIDTHYHWDHTDGNGWIHELGATIVAHQNTLQHLSRPTRVDDWGYTFPVFPASAQPTVLTGTELHMEFDRVGIQIRYYGPSHTDSDVWVYFEGPDVLSTGDTFWNGVYPFIDNENGGSIDGMIKAANANIEKAGAQTIVVSGHGPVGNRDQLIEYRDMLVAIRRNVATLKARGMTRDAVLAAHPTAAFDAKWGGFVIDPDFFTRLVYDGL